MEKPANAVSKITVSTGKVIFFRTPKVIDFEQACKKCTSRDGLDQIMLAKDYAQRLIVGVYRKNGERIIIHDTSKLLREEGVFNFQEITEIANSSPELMEGINKKGKFERL